MHIVERLENLLIERKFKVDSEYNASTAPKGKIHDWIVWFDHDGTEYSITPDTKVADLWWLE